MRSLLLVLVLAAAACGDAASPATTGAAAEGCADVVDAEYDVAADGTYRFSVTVASADTGWEKYADAWEVVAPDGTVLATRVLAHPHVDEQPFTRSQSGVTVPAGVAEVTVRARDSVAGFCGQELDVALAP